MVRTFIATLALILCAGCPGKNGATSGPRDSGDGGGEPPTAVTSSCERIRGAAEKLYKAAPVPDKTTPELAAELIAANVEMVITDCKADPEKVAPCVKAASSAQQMEKDCLIQLDDDGVVDGHQLKANEGANK